MKVPLYEQLYRYVRDEIDAGRLAPGARVPSEKELALQFHVSRITSKRALEKLATEGAVQRARGRGSFVALPAVEAALGQQTEPPLRPRPPLVGLLTPDFSDPFGAQLVRTIERQLRQAHIRTVFCRTEGKRELEEEAIDDCLALGVTGLIIFPAHGQYYNKQLLRLVLDHFPIVLVDRYLRGIPACSVCTDNRLAAETLVNHLIERGHERIAFVTASPDGISSIEDRILGVMAAISGHALPFDAEEDIVYARFTLPGALTPAGQRVERDGEILRAYVVSHPHVTAYVVCEYPMALMARRVLQEVYGEQADRCAIACFDGPGLPSDTVQFTYIEQDEVGMGCEAVRLLLAQLAGEEVPLHVATGHRLVVGAAG